MKLRLGWADLPICVHGRSSVVVSWSRAGGVGVKDLAGDIEFVGR